jgi:hypothetical protein
MTEEVGSMTSSNAKHLPEWPASVEHVPVEELARRQGVKPITSADELAVPGLMDDEEHAEFLADLYASRRAEMA